MERPSDRARGALASCRAAKHRRRQSAAERFSLVAAAASGVVVASACNALWGIGDLQYDPSPTSSTSPGGGGWGGGTSTTTTTSSTGGQTASTTSGSAASGGLGAGGTGANGGGEQGGGGSAPDGFCDEPDLVACYRFDGDTLDGSANHNDAVATGTFFSGAGAMGQSLVRLMGADVTAPADESFGVSALTIEAWVNPTLLPAAGERAVIFDQDDRYSIVFTSTAVECRGRSVQGYSDPVVAPPIETMRWTHLACTIDAAAARIYQDGVVVAEGAGVVLVGTISGVDLGIGQNAPSGDLFVGALDQLRVFGVARTAAQVCVAAGRTDC